LHQSPVLYVVIGCITGTLTGFTGVSGMSVLVSLLLLSGMPVREVIALTFAVTMVNSGIAAVPYGRRGNIPKLPALLMAGATAGAVIPGYFTSHSISSGVLGWCITTGILFVGVKFTFFDRQKPPRENGAESRFPVWVVVIPGAVVGYIIGILGGGGGIFITLLLVMIMRYPAHKALGISLVVMCAAALPGCLLYAKDGLLPAGTALFIILPSMLCSFISARCANRVSERGIKRVLGIYLLLVSILLTLKNLHLLPGVIPR